MSKKIKIGVLAGVVAIVALILSSVSFATIPEGFIGVKTRFGKIVSTEISPGLHMKMPFVESIQRVDIRENSIPLETNAYTKDTQTVEALAMKINYYLEKSQISDIVRNIGINNVVSKLILPQLHSITKNEIGNIKAEELIQNRSELQSKIQEKITKALEQNGIIVTSFNIENIDFENGFEEAVRQKVAAEQEALKAQNETKKKEEMAKQQIIEAEAAATATKMKADAEAYAMQKIQEQLKQNPQYIELERIKKWDGKLPQVTGDSVNPFIGMDSLTGNTNSKSND